MHLKPLQPKTTITDDLCLLGKKSFVGHACMHACMYLSNLCAYQVIKDGKLCFKV
jgi:hypothetical protein